ncbi:hypothetical protein [Peribacillus sp. R9-11]|uniref:hypothetical protein n=1 Tax=Peribacillus sp. R9-11 TaxID=3073271 RepID=UPI0028684720|nr:hypothetical protein [Peribacillus sp. R9-11]WMX55649.1 hypothetical protein RE409_27175 [Peribacillus sp. R9-11]
MENKEIEAPKELTERQIKIARAYANSKVKGISIENLCKQEAISSKTLYTSEFFDNPIWNSYVSALIDASIPESEFAAWDKVKKHVLRLADKDSMSLNEINTFTRVFDYVLKADAERQLRKQDKPAASTESDVEDRKQSLLARLQS